MSRFTDAETILLDGGIHLVTPLTYELFFLGSGLMVSAPAGFWSDGVSFPAWTPTLIKIWLQQIMPLEHMKRAAVVHDLTRKDPRWGKFHGDYAFWEAMGVDNVPAFWRTIATFVVILNNSRY